MATIPKQHAEKKGRKRFKKLFSQIRSQVSVFKSFGYNYHHYHHLLVHKNVKSQLQYAVAYTNVKLVVDRVKCATTYISVL